MGVEERNNKKGDQVDQIKYSLHAAAGVYEGSEEERVARREGEEGGNNKKHKLVIWGKGVGGRQQEQRSFGLLL